jgi:hypothetical protein
MPLTLNRGRNNGRNSGRRNLGRPNDGQQQQQQLQPSLRLCHPDRNRYRPFDQGPFFGTNPGSQRQVHPHATSDERQPSYSWKQRKQPQRQPWQTPTITSRSAIAFKRRPLAQQSSACLSYGRRRFCSITSTPLNSTTDPTAPRATTASSTISNDAENQQSAIALRLESLSARAFHYRLRATKSIERQRLTTASSTTTTTTSDKSFQQRNF